MNPICDFHSDLPELPIPTFRPVCHASNASRWPATPLHFSAAFSVFLSQLLLRHFIKVAALPAQLQVHLLGSLSQVAAAQYGPAGAVADC
jgi:hypothetical protein